MKYLFSFLLIILFFNISCNRSKNIQEVSESADTLKINSTRIVSTLGETLIPTAKKAVLEWKEYHNVDEFIIKYYNISTTEALDYAEELTDLVKIMKDTIRVDKLKDKSVVARINVLHNEALRLNDMSTISTISNEEIKQEVANIVEIYSALNSKINTIYKAEELQNSLEIDTETPIKLIEEPLINKGKRKNKIYKKSNNKLIKPVKTPKSIERE